MRRIADSKQAVTLAILLYLQRAGFYWNILQTWFLPGLRAPDGRFLSRRGERNQRRAKGQGVSIRLSLWKPSPHRSGRGPRPPHLEAPPGANGIASADYTARFSPALWSASGWGCRAVSALHQTGCAVALRGAVRDRSTVLPGAAPAFLFFFGPPSGPFLFLLRPREKEMGGVIVSLKNKASLQHTAK